MEKDKQDAVRGITNMALRQLRPASRSGGQGSFGPFPGPGLQRGQADAPVLGRQMQ